MPAPPAAPHTSPALSLTPRADAEGVVHVTAKGELDLAGRDQADALLRELQLAAGTVVLDLRDVWFMDSTGVHVARDAASRAHRTGSRFALVAGPPLVHRVFDITGTTSEFEWAPAGLDAA